MNYPIPTIRQMVASLKKFGVANQFLQAGVIAITCTEGGFQPVRETGDSGYGKTPNARLRQLFTKRLERYTDDDLLTLKCDNIRFFDVVYGGILGNSAVGDGWKYRGGGFNQLTYRGLYDLHGRRMGIDLVSNPDRISEVPVASDVLGSFFADGFVQGERGGLLKKKYNLEKVNDAADLTTASMIAFQINAGWGTNLSGEVFKKEHSQQLTKIKDIYTIIQTL